MFDQDLLYQRQRSLLSQVQWKWVLQWIFFTTLRPFEISMWGREPLAQEAKHMFGLQLYILTWPQNGLWRRCFQTPFLGFTGDARAWKYYNGSIVKHHLYQEDHWKLLEHLCSIKVKQIFLKHFEFALLPHCWFPEGMIALHLALSLPDRVSQAQHRYNL